MPQVERREARISDRKEMRHASQACRGGFADRPGGSQPPRFSALRSTPSLRWSFGGRAVPQFRPGSRRGSRALLRCPLSTHWN